MNKFIPSLALAAVSCPLFCRPSFAATPVVTVTGASLNEGNAGRTNAQFRIILPETPTKKVGMAFATRPGTAMADKDYVSTRGTIYFAPGVREQTVSVPVVGDTTPESDESFYLDITVTGYTVAQPAAACVIRNDDGTPPGTSSGPGKIVFGVVNNNYQVWAMNSDGTNQTCLTPEGGYNFEQDVSPDGSKIAYVKYDYTTKTDDVWTMNADGSNKKRLTTGQGFNNNPVWSPDGTRLAFVSTREGVSRLFAMNADGSRPIRLSSVTTAGTYTSFNTPDYSWSPDGRRLVFVAAPVKNTELFLVSSDGKTTTQLTNDTFVDLTPVWTPDGSRLLFASNRSSGQELFSIDWSGRVVSQLTNDPRHILARPVFSPDGTHIAFESRLVNGPTFEIECMNADGSNRFLVTNSRRNEKEPVWTLDGLRIIYSLAGAQDTITDSMIYATTIKNRETKLLSKIPLSVRPRVAPGFVPAPARPAASSSKSSSAPSS